MPITKAQINLLGVCCPLAETADTIEYIDDFTRALYDYFYFTHPHSQIWVISVRQYFVHCPLIRPAYGDGTDQIMYVNSQISRRRRLDSMDERSDLYVYSLSACAVRSFFSRHDTAHIAIPHRQSQVKKWVKYLWYSENYVRTLNPNRIHSITKVIFS